MSHEPTISPPAPRLEALVQHMHDHGDELRSLVPLIGEGDDGSMIAGSGTLLRMAGEPFLVTASHVAKYCAERGGFRVPSIVEKVSMSVGATGILATNEDKHDVAVLRIADEVAARLERDGGYFLSTHHIETVAPAELSTGRCLVLGYPQQRTKREGPSIEYGPQAIICEPASPRNADSLSSKYDPQHHFLLHAREVMVEVATGNHEPRIDPRGMSGGSVWWLGAEDDVGSPAERHARVRWIGVQSAAFGVFGPGSGFLKAVSLRSAAALIIQRWPELQPVLNLKRFAAVTRKSWR